MHTYINNKIIFENIERQALDLIGIEIAIVYQRLARRALETAVLHSAPAAGGHRALEPLGPDPRHNHTRQMTDEVMTDPSHRRVM